MLRALTRALQGPTGVLGVLYCLLLYIPDVTYARQSGLAVSLSSPVAQLWWSSPEISALIAHWITWSPCHVV